MPAPDRGSRRTGGANHWAALALTLIVALVVLWPVLAHPDRDGFPLSTYPMFSSPRPAEASFVTVVGLDAAGRSYWLSPVLTNGTREVVQASVVVDQLVRAGRAAQLCHDVATRVARDGGPTSGGAGAAAAVHSGDGVHHLEVVTLRLDLVRYFSAGRPPPGPDPSERAAVHARCAVPR